MTLRFHSDPEKSEPFFAPPRGTLEIVRRTAVYLRPYKMRVVVVLLCSVVSLAAALAFPQLTQYIVDGILARRPRGELLMAIGGLLVFFLLRDVFSALHTAISNYVEQRLIYDLRTSVYRHIESLPIAYFDRKSTGDLLTRVIDDVTDLARLLVEGVEQFVLSVATIAVISVILLFKNAYLTLFCLIPLPFVIVLSAWFTISGHARLRAKRRSLSLLSTMLLDSLQGIRQIKAFDRDGHHTEEFDSYAEDFRRSSIRVLNLWAIYVPTMAFLTSLGTVLIWGLGSLLALKQQLTLGELVSFNFYLAMLYTPVINIHGLNSLMQSARTAGERLFELLDKPCESSVWGGSGHLTQVPRGEIQYEAVSFAYESSGSVLKNIDLQIGAHQTIALAGPAGAGKSTLAHLLLGFYEAGSGRILIDGQDIRDLSLETLRQLVSIVSQQTFLFPGSLRDNILFGQRDASEADLLLAARAADCDTFIKALPQGYDTIVGENGIMLSGGERQRVSIARAILKDAPILILDEATASVDALSERRIYDALVRLRRKRTTIIIAHRLSTIRKADQIVVIEDGTIVERGCHEELVKLQGIYSRMNIAQD